MFKKFTDTLSGTLDTVKTYGSSIGIGQAGQGQDGNAATGGQMGGVSSKLSLNLPVLGNGSVSAPATAATTPNSTTNQAQPSLASNTLQGITSTLGRITGRGDSANALVVASHQGKGGRGPALGRAVETNESRITDLHTLEDDQKVSSYHDITSYEQYKKVSDTGQIKQLEDQLDYGLPPTQGTNGSAAKLVRSNTDEIIDQEFAAAKVNLDDVLDQAEYVDELTPINMKDNSEDKEKKKKPKKKRNKCLQAIINCLQDNRVKGGCVDPEEMAEAAEGHLVLKKVLNIVFLVIGSLLLAAVVVVIVYSSIIDKQAENNPVLTTVTTGLPLNITLAYYDYTVPNDQAGNPTDDLDLERYSTNDREQAWKIQQSFDNLFQNSYNGGPRPQTFGLS